MFQRQEDKYLPLILNNIKMHIVQDWLFKFVISSQLKITLLEQKIQTFKVRHWF
jgi:hypothetical protein